MRRLIDCVVIFTCSLTIAYADAPAPPKWLSQMTRVAYTDLPNIQAQGDWPEKLIPELASAKAQMLFSRVHSGQDWQGLGWRSRFGQPDPKMGDGDGTRRVVELCHQHGLRYMAYYWAQREPVSTAEAHPEWRAINSKGKPTGYFCFNQAGYRTLVRNRIVELVKDWHVDGIFFDMFHARGDECYCPACRQQFQKSAGAEPPVKEEFASLLWQKWSDFRYRSMEAAMLDFNQAIKAANPEAALMVNTWNAWVYRTGTTPAHNARNSIRVVENVDGLLEETGWYDTVDPSFFAFPTLHNFMSWHLGGLCKQGKTPLMWSAGSFARSQPLDFTEVMIRAATMMTNGSVPAQSVPGCDVEKRLLAEIASRDEYFRGARSDRWCGLVVSEKTEQWYGREDPKGRYLKGIYGAFQTLLERHLPVTLVTDRALERGELDGYRVLLLPNCAAMSDAELANLRKFAENGGGVVATYDTAWCDEHGQPRERFGLHEMVDVKKISDFDMQKNVMSFEARAKRGAGLYLPLTHPWSNDPILARVAELRGVSQPEGTKTPSRLLNCRMNLVQDVPKLPAPIRLHTTQERDGKVEKQNSPGLIQVAAGRGKFAYWPMDLTWAWFRFGCIQHARMLELSLREAAAEPPSVEVEAPSIVQAMPQQQGDRLVVHLLNDISSQGRSQNVVNETLYERREVVPIAGIRVTFRDPKLKRFFLVPGGTPLAAVNTPQGQQVKVPRLEIHAMVVGEP